MSGYSIRKMGGGAKQKNTAFPKASNFGNAMFGKGQSTLQWSASPSVLRLLDVPIQGGIYTRKESALPPPLQ